MRIRFVYYTYNTDNSGYIRAMIEDAIPEERLCQTCGKPLDGRKRKDSKFCNEYCRSDFHNKRKAGIDPQIVRINKILANNFEILKTAIGKKEYVVKTHEQLLKKGFNFHFYTMRPSEYTYVYSLAYKMKEKDSYVIVKAFESVLKAE